ncbi:MAG TPA: serine hydrolase [Candidatus Baltobacteraceae bacterium]
MLLINIRPEKPNACEYLHATIARAAGECKYLLAYRGVLTAKSLAHLVEQSELLQGSVVLCELNGPEREAAWTLAYEPRRTLPAASMIKLPIAAALAARLDEGGLRSGDRYAVATENMTANDAASPLIPGYRAALEELGRLMLTRSDNVATNMLIDILGREAISAYASGLGLRDTVVRRKLSGSVPLIPDPGANGRNAHSAADCASLLEQIALGTVAGSGWLQETLAAQEWNEKLSPGLAPGDRFAHKTGDTDEVTHDGGILDTAQGRRYVLVVYTALASSPQNDARLTAFMRALRPHL